MELAALEKISWTTSIRAEQPLTQGSKDAKCQMIQKTVLPTRGY